MKNAAFLSRAREQAVVFQRSGRANISDSMFSSSDIDVLLPKAEPMIGAVLCF
jgi:hypothetical protein